MRKNSLVLLLLLGSFLIQKSIAAVPEAVLVGPIEAEPPGHPSKNSSYAASAIELTATGYIEEEYFIFGDNLSLVTSSILPSLKLHKRSHLLNYHRVRE